MALNKDKSKYEARLAKMEAESLISIDELKASSILDYNITPAKILPHIITAQALRLEPMIGTKLYQKLQEDNLTFEYQLLMDNYIYNYLVHQALAEFLKVGSISAKEGGLYRHFSTDSEPLTMQEVGIVSKNEDYKAAEYSKRMLQFLHDYETYYPEFTECIGGGREAKGYRKVLGGWNLRRSINRSSNELLNRPEFADELYVENVLCGSCPPDDSIFAVTFAAGNNDEELMGFDPITLDQQFSTKPSTITLQALGEYMWVVGSMDFDLTQAGAVIPTVPFNNPGGIDGEIFVKGEQNSLFWIRIKRRDTYEHPVVFGIK